MSPASVIRRTLGQLGNNLAAAQARLPSVKEGAAMLLLGEAQYRALMHVARRAAGLEQRFVEAGGLRLPVFVRGLQSPARPIVMIHGFGADKEGWLMLAREIDKDRPIVAMDLPGFGEAPPIPKERAAARAQAGAVAAVLDALELGKAHLVGNSMGGAIAQTFARDYPDRALSMTLLGSVGPLVEKTEAILEIEAGTNPLILEHEDDLDRLLALVCERMPPSTRAMRRYLGAMRFARSDVLHELFDGFAYAPPEESFPAELGDIHTPALVIHGAEDRIFPVATGRALAEQLPNARLRLLEGIGHMPHVETPRRTAELIDEFISSLER